MKLPIFISLFLLILVLYVTSYMLYAYAQSITISATVDEHLSWHKDGQNLIISTNKTEGFILYTNGKRISKKGPVILTVPNYSNFILTSGY